MHLLELVNGKLNLRAFSDWNLPSYAIVSHQWTNDEVSFQDILGNTGQHKAGYAKVQIFAKQAAQDHYQYVWIDSCCIDRTNSSEYSEAINSMFRWFVSDVLRAFVP